MGFSSKDDFIPAALRHPPPRATRMRPEVRDNIRVGKMVRTMSFTAGVISLLVFCFYLALHTMAPTWPAEITDLRMVHVKGNQRQPSTKEWYLDYRFGPTGQTQQKSQEVSDGFWHTIHKGASWRVRAWTFGDFHVSMLEVSPREFLHEKFLWLFLCAFAGAFGGLFHLTFGPGLSKRQRLIATGLAARGVITEKMWPPSRKSKPVGYQFRDDKGNQVTGKKIIPSKAYRALAVGQEILVVYLPENSQTNTLYDYEWYEAVE